MTIGRFGRQNSLQLEFSNKVVFPISWVWLIILVSATSSSAATVAIQQMSDYKKHLTG